MPTRFDRKDTVTDLIQCPEGGIFHWDSCPIASKHADDANFAQIIQRGGRGCRRCKPPVDALMRCMSCGFAAWTDSTRMDHHRCPTCHQRAFIFAGRLRLQQTDSAPMVD